MAEVLVWGQVPFTGNIPGSARLKKCCQVSKFGEKARFPSSQPITSHSHKSWMRSFSPRGWTDKGLTLAAWQKGDDRAKADSESQLCYLCGFPVRFPWLQSEPAQLWDVHQRYLHAEAENMSSCGSAKTNGISWLWQSTWKSSRPLV